MLEPTFVHAFLLDFYHMPTSGFDSELEDFRRWSKEEHSILNALV